MKRLLVVAAISAAISSGASDSCDPADSNTPECVESRNVCASVFENGDGVSRAGYVFCADDFADVDALLLAAGAELNIPDAQWEGSKGAKLFASNGKRIFNLRDDVTDGDRLYAVRVGLHFVWPRTAVGSVVYPFNVSTPNSAPIKLRQLSNAPNVWQIENFVSDTEIAEIIEANAGRMKRSEVGFAGWKDDTRTSSTSWDASSPAALAIQRRAFEILRVDYDVEMADALQVLSYTPDQWYKPHVDYFTSEGFDGATPNENNGTNRFATVFVYLSDVEFGGSTVFPLSTTHTGYNGEYLVHNETINTPGYIDTMEARACCEDDSAALKSKPVKGNAVLFYSQDAQGELDPYSLHGGCPPKEGSQIKWSANIWVWNRPKPDKMAAKDGPIVADDDGGFLVSMENKLKQKIELVWDPSHLSSKLSPYDQLVVQERLSPGDFYNVRTFPGHVFRAMDPTTHEPLWTGRMPSDWSPVSTDDVLRIPMAHGNDYNV